MKAVNASWKSEGKLRSAACWPPLPEPPHVHALLPLHPCELQQSHHCPASCLLHTFRCLAQASGCDQPSAVQAEAFMPDSAWFWELLLSLHCPAGCIMCTLRRLVLGTAAVPLLPCRLQHAYLKEPGSALPRPLHAHRPRWHQVPWYSEERIKAAEKVVRAGKDSRYVTGACLPCFWGWAVCVSCHPTGGSLRLQQNSLICYATCKWLAPAWHAAACWGLCGGPLVRNEISSPSTRTQAVRHTQPTDSQLGLT